MIKCNIIKTRVCCIFKTTGEGEGYNLNPRATLPDVVWYNFQFFDCFFFFFLYTFFDIFNRLFKSETRIFTEVHCFFRNTAVLLLRIIVIGINLSNPCQQSQRCVTRIRHRPRFIRLPCVYTAVASFAGRYPDPGGRGLQSRYNKIDITISILFRFVSSSFNPSSGSRYSFNFCAIDTRPYYGFDN